MSSIRGTGRTTKMLVDLAVYISENWYNDKRVILSAVNDDFAISLMEKISSFLGGRRVSRDEVKFGKLIVKHGSDSLRTKLKGFHIDKYFNDHYYE